MDDESGRNSEPKVANFHDAGPGQHAEKFVGDLVDDHARKREPTNDETGYHIN
jgi:hypothetical protein